HQMGGFDRDRLNRDLIPEGFEPGTMTVIGYPGDIEKLPEDLAERERAPRQRRPLGELAFSRHWGESPSFV
ncbi:MAG: nitroreductase, partial [Gemmatimonadota bacterium]